MKRLILASASVLALGIAAAGGAMAAGASSTAPGATSTMPTAPMHSQNTQAPTSVTKDQIEQAQQQLKSQGLYPGPVDGVMGAETQQAIGQYQRKKGLTETATLDHATMQSLLGNGGASGSSTMPGYGSSTPPKQPMTSPSPSPSAPSNLGGSGSYSR
jgi:peptidoglycan hydrolase-like protein with peptidoglycan-binding domain